MKQGEIAASLPLLSTPASCIDDVSSLPMEAPAVSLRSDRVQSASSPARWPQSAPSLSPSAVGEIGSSFTMSSPQASSSEGAQSFKVLYLFAGEKRNNDIGTELRDIVNRASGANVEIDEVDLCRGSDHDLLNQAIWGQSGVFAEVGRISDGASIAALQHMVKIRLQC